MAHKWPTIASSVYYEDPLAAIEWLERAFGFERAMVITGPDGKLAHSQLTFEDGYIMVGSPWADFIATPGQVGGKNTQDGGAHPGRPPASTPCATARAPRARTSCRELRETSSMATAPFAVSILAVMCGPSARRCAK